MEKIRICLSDIPKDKMIIGSNKKIYVSLIVDKRKELDQWKQDLKVYVDQTQDERKSGKTKTYVGSGKTVEFNQQTASDNDVSALFEGAKEAPKKGEKGVEQSFTEKDDLPF